MTNYELEIQKLENITSKYINLPDKQLWEFLYTYCGLILINLQKTEFLIHGFVSIFNESVLASDKNFKKLNPRVFLDSDDNSKKNRKQTLGTIIKFIISKTAIFDEQELNNYAELRNTFIHSFLREFLSTDKANKRDDIYKAIKFLIELDKNDIKWQCIFKGMFYHTLQHFARLTDKDISMFEEYKKYQVDFLKHMSR